MTDGIRTFTKRRHDRAGSRADSVFVLILVCAFAICSLFVILFGAQVYNGVRSRSEENHTVRTGLAYLRTKLQSYDEQGAVHVTADGLLLITDYDFVMLDTYIYFRDGAIREYAGMRFVGFEEEVDLDSLPGDIILPASGFDAVFDGSVYWLTVYGLDGTAYDCIVARRSS